MPDNLLLYEVKGQGEPLILVPGGLSGWLSWIPVAERLKADHQVVRVQLRSIELAGKDQAYPPGYSTRTEVDALKATVDKLGLNNFDLAGWSFGGHVALAFALEYPERVRTLTLIEPAAIWVLREAGFKRDRLMEGEAADRSLAGRKVTEDDLKEFLVQVGLAKAGENFEGLPQWPVWKRNRQALSVNSVLWDYTDSLDRLNRLNMPVLLVKGTETAEHLAAIIDILAVKIPQSRLLELPGGHNCHLQNMERFLTELKNHITPVTA